MTRLKVLKYIDMVQEALLNFIKRSSVNKYLVGFFTILIAGIILQASYVRIDRLFIDLAPESKYFEYLSVEFVEKDENALIFASTSVIKESYPIFWNDILRCQDGKDYRFFSVQNSNSTAPEKRVQFREVYWNYNEPFPIGRTCILESTITMDIKGITKTSKIISNPFTVK